ncbi:MAG: type II toxin-antitoxin system RelB/DinJ family antitoxin [Chitinispirillales bacterium]|jgi:DNA-damage-inducible protein J|nr:type II toxin-antitoxin system RelB/DinJ family antitoxin [Chitinispirillales bacterium]
MKTATYNIRIAPDIKTKAEEAFSALGLDMNEAIDTFLREVITGYGLPCEMREKVPNAETQAAIDEFEAMARGEIPFPPSQSVAEVIAELEKELEEESSG